MVKGFPFAVPPEYSGLPQLKARPWTLMTACRPRGHEVMDLVSKDLHHRLCAS